MRDRPWETGRAMRSDSERSEKNRWRLVVIGTALCFLAAIILAFADVTPWARVPPAARRDRWADRARAPAETGLTLSERPGVRVVSGGAAGQSERWERTLTIVPLGSRSMKRLTPHASSRRG